LDRINVTTNPTAEWTAARLGAKRGYVLRFSATLKGRREAPERESGAAMSI
jgi:hypothetical protein